MFQIAKAKDNGLRYAFVGDAHDLVVPEEYGPLLGGGGNEGGSGFDAVFSNATLHWCKRDPLAVLRCARRVLKPSGRIVGEMGGFMNCIGE